MTSVATKPDAPADDKLHSMPTGGLFLEIVKKDSWIKVNRARREFVTSSRWLV